MKELFIYAFLTILLFSIGFVISQQSILSVSSFRSCASVDSRYQNASTANSAFTLINCTTDTANLPEITVIDLRLTPGIGNASNLLFNISVVQGQANGAGDVPATSASECQLSDPTSQLCFLTTPTVVNVQSTNIVYRYKLNLVPNNIEVPYCYGSLAVFEQYRSSSQKCQDLCENYASSIDDDCDTFTGCIPVQNPSYSVISMLNKKMNILENQANTDDFKLNAFLRTQQPVNAAPIKCINFKSTVATSVTEYGELCEFSNNLKFKDAAIDIIERQGNLRTVNGVDVNDYYDNFFLSPCSLNDPSAGLCRKSLTNTTTDQILYDNSNYDIRIPTFLPMPSVFGTTPNPIYRNLIESPVTMASEISLPLGTSTSTDAGSVSFSCAGYDCAANQDARRSQRLVDEAINDPSVPTSYFNTLNSIVSLGPQCSVYLITQEPEVVAEINIEITTNSGSADEHTETIKIDNFSPSGSSTSSPFRYAFGRIENIQTPTGILGPSLTGAMILCGQRDNKFINMQCLREGVECDFDQTVLENSTDFSETKNPWTTIIETSQNQAGFEKRVNFYPHPYDYIIPDAATNQKDLDAKYLPGDNGQTFWYFVSATDLINQFGVECNKIGMAQGVNSMQQNANLFCNLDPHSCLPGLGPSVNGGLKTALPCKVSSYMNFASGLYNGTDIPQPYLGSTSTGTLDFGSSEQFIQNMVSLASNFVPNNIFLSQINGSDPTRSTPLYDPQNPQFWLGFGAAGDENTYLYYSPSTTDGNQYYTNIAVELVLDIVGTFVGYTTNVSAGIIVPQNSTCQFTQGTTADILIYVENPSLQGIGVTTDYILSLDCNPPGQTSGIGIDVLDNDRPITLSPEQASLITFTVSTSSGIPITNQLGCIASLFYADAVQDALSSTQSINCGITLQLSNNSYSDGGATPSPPTEVPVVCTGFCNLNCYINQGTPWQSGCFWLVVGIPFLLILGFIGTLIFVLYTYCYKSNERSTAQLRSDRFIRSEEERTQQITDSSLNTT